jgi:hypothetical protein
MHQADIRMLKVQRKYDVSLGHPVTAPAISAPSSRTAGTDQLQARNITLGRVVPFDAEIGSIPGIAFFV